MSSPTLLARRAAICKPGTAEAEAVNRLVCALRNGDRLRFTAELIACRAAMRGQSVANIGGTK